MAKLTPSKIPGKKAGPNGSFPVSDPKHARLAIGGATRSFNAGNISASTESKIKTAARSELKKAAPAKAPAKGKNPSANKTSPAAAKSVPFQHPPAAFPMDAMHAGNVGKK